MILTVTFASLWHAWKTFTIALAVTACTLTAAGALANHAVMAVNGDLMPVIGGPCAALPDLRLGPGHACAGPRHAKLLILADRIPIGPHVYSAGDLAAAAGLLLAFTAGAALLPTLPGWLVGAGLRRLR